MTVPDIHLPETQKVAQTGGAFILLNHPYTHPPSLLFSSLHGLPYENESIVISQEHRFCEQPIDRSIEMVITTPHVVRSFLHERPDERTPHQKIIMDGAKSTATVRLSFKGCQTVKGPELSMTDVECFLDRIVIGRAPACHLRIPDDFRISRYHSVIECSRDGRWTFRDLGSKSGSSLKPKQLEDEEEDPYGPRLQPRILDKRVPYSLQNHDVILIGRVHQGLAHELEVTIQSANGTLEEIDSGDQQAGSRRLTWRRSLHCNGCQGWSRRHSCSARLSQIQKMILECNRTSKISVSRPPKTAVQKVLFHRLSGWWPKKPDRSVTFRVPQHYDDDAHEKIRNLPDQALDDSVEQFDEDGDDDTDYDGDIFRRSQPESEDDSWND